MKAYLMYGDRDFDLQAELPSNAETLVKDLELDTLFGAMAAGDRFLFDVAKHAVLSTLIDPEAIHYRQRILADCLAQPAIVRKIYALAVEAIDAERKIWGWGMGSPDSILHRSVQALELFVDFLKRLTTLGDEHAARFRSEGFRRFFAMLDEELDEEYFGTVERHLADLKFRRGVLISAELGRGNKGRRHVLRATKPEPRWIEWISSRRRSGYSFDVPARDENGFRALSELRGKGINLVANALAQSTDHILSFFQAMRAELAFYVGCLNLRDRLDEKGEPSCFPTPVAPGRAVLSATGLYDPCLSLHMESRIVGNEIRADGKSLVMITGANQGGKSTFLRSVGVAHLMMQSGMFVAAQSFTADVRDGLFTHYKREEDATMTSGKLDEELRRMSSIADEIGPGCLLLCNESFASTNEREGSEIARQVVHALIEADIKVLYVTHLFDLAHGFHLGGTEGALFLRAERGSDGRRTFLLVEGEPLPTSYGEDSYRRIFGTDSAVRAAATADTGP